MIRNEPTRRRLVTGLAAVVTVGLAGCANPEEDDGNNETDPLDGTDGVGTDTEGEMETETETETETGTEAGTGTETGTAAGTGTETGTAASMGNAG
jgi:hypothetical protein